MREIHKFIADDGVEFEDASECREYELKNRMDDIGNDLQLYNDANEPCSNPDAAYFIIARTPAAKTLLSEACEFYDTATPWDQGVYYDDVNSESANAWYFDEGEGAWFSFNYLCEQARKLNDKINRMGAWLTL